MRLPELFLENMKDLLGEEYPEWLAGFDQTPARGMRINTAKADRCPFAAEKIPWTSNGYYYGENMVPSKHPYYAAGLYYLQEPSAMTPAQMLPVKPGDKVLDLCAAPGGKSTELGAKLCKKGLLVANDISNSRAKALLKNLELFGIPNICVTSEAPDKLADTFGAYFDKILVDAPCSGEGMFRKDPDLIRSYAEKGPEYYAELQKKILTQAVRMLKPDGYLLYSTCTFSTKEDEDNVAWLLQTEPEMELCNLPLFDGAVRGVAGEPVIRLFPHKVRGEGHFLALFHRKGSAAGDSPAVYLDNRKTLKYLEKETDFCAFEKRMTRQFIRERLMLKDNMLYELPDFWHCGWKLRYLRTGLLLGELKNGRFEPSQALAMTLKQEDYANTISFSWEQGDETADPVRDDRVIRYLKGETIALTEAEQSAAGKTKGWCLVCVDGYPMGWAKYAGTMLKNKYYPGWRWQ